MEPRERIRRRRRECRRRIRRQSRRKRRRNNQPLHNNNHRRSRSHRSNAALIMARLDLDESRQARNLPASVRETFSKNPAHGIPIDVAGASPGQEWSADGTSALRPCAPLSVGGLGFGLGVGLALAGDVGAGFEVVMLGQAVSAEMQMMNAAFDGRLVVHRIDCRFFVLPCRGADAGGSASAQ